MATLVVTFNFATDAESFSGTAGASCTLTYQGSDGNPSGSLQTVITKNNGNESSYWDRTLTWEDMGVPTDSLITGVTSASADYKCTAGNRIGSCTAGAVTLADGGTTITLSAGAGFSATHASWQTSNGTDSTGLSLSAGNNTTLTINNNLVTTAGNGGTVTLLQDKITFTITYSPPVSQVVSGALGSVTATGLTGTFEAGAEFNGAVGALSVLGAVSDFTHGQLLVSNIGTVVTTGLTGTAEAGLEVSGSIASASVIGLTGTFEAGAEFNGTISIININGETGTFEAGLEVVGSGGTVTVSGYVGSVRISDPVIARINSILAFQIAGELTENAAAGKQFYDSVGNLEIKELTEGSTFFMDENNNLTVVTFEEDVTF